MRPRARLAQSYRIFQHQHAPGLCCAVREGLLVPRFLQAREWSVSADVRDDRRLPFGFQPLPAREATAAFGYYLFHHPCEILSPRYSREWGDTGHSWDRRWDRASVTLP